MKKPTHSSKCCSPLSTKDKTQLTFEDNLQLVPQNVKDAVAGTGLWDDMALQPTPAGVLVEIVTRLHRLIHVLQEPGSFKTSQRKAGGGGGKRGAGGQHGKDLCKAGGDFVRGGLFLTCSNTICSCAHIVGTGAKQLPWKNQCQQS